jgi:alkanesulfonate monooxygenase SsuD/methylene tetrahydromethanopterin reductase-like flavin-dependent oxidoreductase (luciferase family)
MFELLSTIGDGLRFVADHRYAALAAIIGGGGFTARAYLPVIGAPVSKACFAAAIGLGCFDGGYSLRARQDRTADLRAEADALREDIRAAAEVAEFAKLRSEDAERQRAADQRKVDDYEKILAKRGDCPLSRDDARRMQQLGREAAPASSAGELRKAGPITSDRGR